MNLMVNLKGITNTSPANPSIPVTPQNTELQTETIALVTPENTELMPDTANNTNETFTPVPVGHDTATTDEEEAAEALLALSNLLDMDDEDNGSDDNAYLMPIDGPSTSIDVNPIEVKLGADDINQAIEQLPITQLARSRKLINQNPKKILILDNIFLHLSVKFELKIQNTHCYRKPVNFPTSDKSAFNGPANGPAVTHSKIQNRLSRAP